MIAPFGQVPVFRLPPPEFCDNCDSYVDVRWQDLDGNNFMALCAFCSGVGGSDEG